MLAVRDNMVVWSTTATVDMVEIALAVAVWESMVLATK